MCNTHLQFLAATKQLYEWFSPSVCPSVCHTFFTMFPAPYYHEIFVIVDDRSDVHARGQGQRSKVKVTEVMTLLSRFGTVTPVWIHIWWWNDAQSLMLLRRGALLFFKVDRQISRSHGYKNVDFDPNWAFPDSNYSLNLPMAMKQCTKFETASKDVPYRFSRSSVKFQSHTEQKIADFDPNWAFPDCNSSLNSPMTSKWCTKLNIV